MDRSALCHILTRAQWEKAQAQGDYRPESLRAEGFIHLSTVEQVTAVANRFFRGQQGLLVLLIDPIRLKSAVKFEAVPDSPEKYPHLYGFLNLDAVVEVRSLEPAADGAFGGWTI